MKLAWPHTPASLIGLTLIAAFYGVTTFHLSRQAYQARAEDVVVIRFAHWNLEEGVREVYDEIAAAYMALHPHVHVEQLAIPHRVYPAWLRTQLIGGTAPDLIALGGQGITDELMARYFQPLTTDVEAPNPYNRGTPLEAVSWRDTFVDGLTSHHIFNERLQEVYSIGLGVPTFRGYYNLDLFREIMGHEQLPRTFRELLDLCERTAAWSRQQGRAVLPIAASVHHALPLLHALAAVRTQRLLIDQPGRGVLILGDEDLLIEMMAGRLSWRDPPMVDALAAMQAAGRWFPPGFLQTQREDMAFQFVQGRAVMMTTGSFDLRSLRSQAPFQLAVGPIPLPDTNDPEFSRGVLGPLPEIAVGSGRFALTRNSRHPSAALDFLRYLSSVNSNSRFAARSEWIPAVVGAQVPATVKAFQPNPDGFPAPLNLFAGLGPFPDVFRTMLNRHSDLLFSRTAPLEAYLEAVDRDFPPALRNDLERITRHRRANLRRLDTLIGILELDSPAWADRSTILRQSQLNQEIAQAWLEYNQ
jgi:raffinose/stachyose/melibiose transport system substrate-binding protein